MPKINLISTLKNKIYNKFIIKKNSTNDFTKSVIKLINI